MSLMDDLKAAIAPGNPLPRANFDDIFEKWDKKYREQGLLPTGFEILEYETGRMGNRQVNTIQVPIYKEAQQAAIDQYVEDELAAGRLIKAGDEDKVDVPEAKIYEGDYVSKFAEGGEGYVNPYPSPLEAQQNIPPSGPSSGGTFTGAGLLGGIAAGISGLNAAGQADPGGLPKAFVGMSPIGIAGQILSTPGYMDAIKDAQAQGPPPSSAPPSSGFTGQDVLQGFADLKSTPIPELQINPSVSAPVTEALPVNTAYDNSATINNILGGLSSVTAPVSVEGPKGLGASRDFRIMNEPPEATQAVTPAPTAEFVTIPGTDFQSKYDPAAADELLAKYKANKAKEALLNPPPIPEPYDGLNRTLNPKPDSSQFNFGLPSIGIMGAPDAQPPAAQPPAVQPPPTASTETDSQGDGLTPQQKQFMQTVRGLEESAKQRAAVERVTRQNMARAGQTADIRLGIQNGRTASGLDAFKRRFKIGQQSPSTNLMINA